MSKNQTQNDFLIYNSENSKILEGIKKHKLNVQLLPINDKAVSDILLKSDGEMYELNILGKHNLFNASCVVKACQILGLDEEEIARGLKSFVNVPHRLELLGKIKGVSFINDSKATNVDAVFWALDGVKSRIIWIVGASIKGMNMRR